MTTVSRVSLSGLTVSRGTLEAIARLVPGWTPAHGVVIFRSAKGLTYQFRGQTGVHIYEVQVDAADVEQPEFDVWNAVENALLDAAEEARDA